MAWDPEQIAIVHGGFREGRASDVSTVRRWIAQVVDGGSWRFSDPEGVAQEILLELYHLARSGKVDDPSAFQKLVWVVAKNRCVSQYHRERRRREVEEPDAAADAADGRATPEDELTRRESFRLLLVVYQTLPARCRQLWDWVYRERLEAAEVGRRLGISTGNVRVRVHRCLEAAREAYRRASSLPSVP